MSWIQLYLYLIFKRILSVNKRECLWQKHQIKSMLENVNTIINQFNSRGISVVNIGNEFETHQWVVNFFGKNEAQKGS